MSNNRLNCRETEMKRMIAAFALALILCSCMSPTTRHPRIPSVNSHDMKKIRREITRYSYKHYAAQRQRIQSLGYNIFKNTGQELCDRKLVQDIGVDFMKVNKLTASKFFNPNYNILKNEYDDVKKIFKKNAENIWIEGVYTGSAAAKAGLKKGDLLISYNGVNAPTGKKAFEQLYKTIRRTDNSGLPVEIVVERDNKTLSFEFEPDMICPYSVYTDASINAINAYADGANIYLSQQLVDYVDDDTALAAVISHELAHNVLGHREAKTTNMGVGLILGATADILTRGNGMGAASGANAGALAFSKEFEMEADYVSVYFMARAGYDYKSMGIIQKMLAARNHWSNYQDGETHPTPSARYALMMETAKEIDLKKAFGEEISPDFGTVNKHLRNKVDITRKSSLW